MTNKQNEQTMSKNLDKFIEEYGGYIFQDVFSIAIETSINYIPLRNHVTAIQMLKDDELYNQLSNSEKFDWKSKFLSDEEECEHLDIMTNQFLDKCIDLLNNNDYLVETMLLDYSIDEITQLYNDFLHYVWEQFIGRGGFNQCK